MNADFVCLLIFLSVVSSEKYDSGNMENQLRGSHLQLFQVNDTLYLVAYTAVSDPEDVILNLQCSDVGGEIMQNDDGKMYYKHPFLIHVYKGEGYFNRYSNFTELLSGELHTYVFRVWTYHNGCVQCKDKLGIGLLSNELFFNSALGHTFVLKYLSTSIKSFMQYIRESGEHLPILFINTDRLNLTEITVRHTILENSSRLWNDSNSTGNNLMIDRRSSSVCYGTEILSETKLGFRTTPAFPCIDKSGALWPSLRCLGNSVEGAVWEEMEEVHCDKFTPSKEIRDLFKASDINETLTRIMEEFRNRKAPLNAAEVDYLSKGLLKTAQHTVIDYEVSLFALVNIVDFIIKFGGESLRYASGYADSSYIILEAIEKLLKHPNSHTDVSFVGKNFSVISLRENTCFMSVSFDFMLYPARQEFTLENIISMKPRIAVYRINEIKTTKLTFSVFENDKLFSNYDLRKSAYGPVVGVTMEKIYQSQMTTVIIFFRRDPDYPITLRCALFDTKTNKEWTINRYDCRNVATKHLKSSFMDACICSIFSTEFIYIGRIHVNEDFDATKYLLEKQLKMPRLELKAQENTQNAFLSIYSPEILELNRPIIDSLECSVNAGHVNEYPLAWNPKIYTVLRNSTVHRSTSNQKSMIVRVFNEVDGEMTCKDRMGLGLISNKITIKHNNTAVARYKTSSPDSLDRFLTEYAYVYAETFRMIVRVQFKSKNVGYTEFVLRFSQSSAKSHTEFIEHVKQFSDQLILHYKWKIIYLRSTRYCLSVQEEGFFWPITKQGKTTIPVEPCVTPTGIPFPSRTCLGDHLEGSFWEEAPRRPSTCLKSSAHSQRLQNITHQKNKMKALEEAAEFLEPNSPLQDNLIMDPFMVILLSKLLQDAASDISDSGLRFLNVSASATVLDCILGAGKDVINNADNITGSSDMIRESIEILFASSISSEPVTISKPHFSVLAADLNSGIRGFSASLDNNGEKHINAVVENSSIEDMVFQKMKVTAYFKTNSLTDGVLTSVLFQDDSLFVEATGMIDKKVSGPVVGMSLMQSEAGRKFIKNDEPVDLILIFPRGNEDPYNSSCSYWSQDEKWSGVGCDLLPRGSISGIPHDMDVCHCTHITYFALLITLNPISGVLNEEYIIEQHEVMLHHISIIGCSISLTCLLIILIMGAVSSKFRAKPQKGLHLQIAASQALLMTTYIAISSYGTPLEIGMNSCIAMGVILHYSHLASFLWTFMAAVFLSIKYNPKPPLILRSMMGSHPILRASFSGWCFPIIPVLITLMGGTNQYQRRPRSALCYPEGNIFFASVIFPVAVVLGYTFKVFCSLVLLLFTQTLQAHENNDLPTPAQNIFFALLHFVLLGLFWAFGLAMSYSTGKTLIALAYFFCITATLQGCSMLVLFVLWELDCCKKCKKWDNSVLQVHFKPDGNKENGRLTEELNFEILQSSSESQINEEKSRMVTPSKEEAQVSKVLLREQNHTQKTNLKELFLVMK